MPSEWSRKIALLGSGISSKIPEEPKEETATVNNDDLSFGRKRKRNQQDRYLTKRQAHNHPSLNKD